MVCGPREKYLEKTLKEFSRLCDGATIATNNATPEDKALIASYGFNQYEDNREWGKEQPNIKTKLLQEIQKENPDWILVLDADETVPTVTREILEELTKGRESCFFYVTNLWDDEEHYKKVASFWNVRFYKSDPSKGTQFLRKALHCGNAPPYFYSKSPKESYVPHILLHRGLMDPADRARKVERYDKYDPNAIHKGREYYDLLRQIDSPKAEYTEERVLTRITDFLATLK